MLTIFFHNQTNISFIHPTELHNILATSHCKKPFQSVLKSSTTLFNHHIITLKQSRSLQDSSSSVRCIRSMSSDGVGSARLSSLDLLLEFLGIKVVTSGPPRLVRRGDKLFHIENEGAGIAVLFILIVVGVLSIPVLCFLACGGWAWFLRGNYHRSIAQEVLTTTDTVGLQIQHAWDRFVCLLEWKRNAKDDSIHLSATGGNRPNTIQHSWGRFVHLLRLRRRDRDDSIELLNIGGNHPRTIPMEDRPRIDQQQSSHRRERSGSLPVGHTQPRINPNGPTNQRNSIQGSMSHRPTRRQQDGAIVDIDGSWEDAFTGSSVNRTLPTSEGSVPATQ